MDLNAGSMDPILSRNFQVCINHVYILLLLPILLTDASTVTQPSDL
jgi:hypothetical protein